jgi:hypothetical protein
MNLKSNYALLFLSMLLVACAGSKNESIAELAAQNGDGLCSGKGGAIKGKGNRKQAIVDISQQITSSVKIDVSDVFRQKTIDGISEDESSYEEIVRMASEFLAAGRLEQLNDSVFYICRSDAAKPYLDSLKKYLKSELEDFARQRLDEKSCEAAKKIYDDKMLGWQGIVEDLRQPNPWRKEYEEAYGKIRKECCYQSAKLHWNPAKETIYSEMAFAKLSQKLKIEKSPCGGRGVSLVYKNPESKCEHAGIFSCSHQPSLLIASCEGAEYRLLKGPEVGGFHQKESVALERLQGKLKDNAFWSEWEREIKQCSPQCE